MDKETLGIEVKVCKTCKGLGFITTEYLAHNDKIAGFESVMCEDPDCNVIKGLNLKSHTKDIKEAKIALNQKFDNIMKELKG